MVTGPILTGSKRISYLGSFVGLVDKKLPVGLIMGFELFFSVKDYCRDVGKCSELSHNGERKTFIHKC